jgi:hypothetical protein
VEQDQGCKEGGQRTPSWNTPPVLECEQLYVDAHFPGGALHKTSAFYTFCSEWPYAVFFSVSQYTSDVIVVPCCMNWAISTPCLSCLRKQLPSAFWQTCV